VFTARYGLIPCIKQITFRLLKFKQVLRGRRFTKDQQLDVTVHAWLVSQPNTFYSELTKQIVRWWTECTVQQGDCVKKLCSCKIPALVFLNMKHTVRINIDSPSYVNIVYIVPPLREWDEAWNTATAKRRTFCHIKLLQMRKTNIHKLLPNYLQMTPCSWCVFANGYRQDICSMSPHVTQRTGNCLSKHVSQHLNYFILYNNVAGRLKMLTL
jgi:hypothetical protein